jgi:DNA-binding protein H-NS
MFRWKTCGDAGLPLPDTNWSSRIMKIDVDRLSLKQLIELEVKLNRAKSQARDRAKAELKENIEQLLAGTGFTIAELYGFGGKRGRSSGVPKYANPDDSTQTWTGRGRKPNWLVARMKKGAKLEQFAL